MTSFLLAIGAVFTRLVRSLFSRLAGLCHERSFILDAARNAGLPSEDRKQLQSLLPRTVRALQLVEYAIHRAPRLRLASERKLSKSPHTIHESSEIESESENEREYEGKGVRMLEVAGLQSALGGVCCSECKSGPIVFREEMSGGLHISVSLL